MGQACATDATLETTPPPRSRRYTTSAPSDESPNTVTAAPTPQRPNGGAKGGPKVSHKIRSMEHRSVPRFDFVDRSMYAATFREFLGLTSASIQAVLAMDVDHSGPRVPDHANVLVAAGEDRNIYVVNYSTGHILSTLRDVHDKDINALQLNQSGTVVFSASRDKLIKATEIETGAAQSFHGHALNVTSIHLNPANDLLVSGSRDNTVRLWDVETASLLHTADIKLNVVHFVRWLRGDFENVVVQGGEDLTLRLWDTRTSAKDDEGVSSGRGDGTLSLSQRGVFTNFDYHPTCVELCPVHSWRLWTGHNGFNGQGSMITEWDIRMGKQVRQFVRGHSFTIRSIKLLSPAHGDHVMLSASDDMALATWNTNPIESDAAANGAVQDDGVVQTLPFREGQITSLTEDGDGNILVGTRGNSVVVLRTINGVLGMRHRYVGSPAIP